jgi:hypothetical protein
MSGNGIEAQRLLQAVEHFKARTRGAELPKGVDEALKGLGKALETPMPDRDTPGGREALKVAPGTRGTGEHFSQAVKGRDGPSPGQKEAELAGGGVSKEVSEAATALAAKIAT